MPGIVIGGETTLDKSIKDIGMDRKIIEKSGQRLLVISSTEDLKVISSPQRQRIFKLLQTAGKPLHGKAIADYVGISGC